MRERVETPADTQQRLAGKETGRSMLCVCVCVMRAPGARDVTRADFFSHEAVVKEW